MVTMLAKPFSIAVEISAAHSTNANLLTSPAALMVNTF